MNNFYDDNDCPHCDGTGEGMYDGQSCGACRGSGIAKGEREDDEFNEPYADDF